MRRSATLVYGIVCYLIFFGTFLYAVGFLGNFFVPKSIDSPPTSSLAIALIVNFGLLGVFAVQHSVMARPQFKARWTRIIGRPIERSTYVLASNLAMILLFWQWRPLGGVIWDIQDARARISLHVLCAAGWTLLFISTCLINHFDLFGLRQVWFYFRGREYAPLPFKTPALYRVVRHPLYVGWITAFWATPTMTASHLLFALGSTAYILVAIRFEERDLLGYHREYAEYRERVPMLIPRVFRSKTAEQAAGR